ncbi:MAG TPA: DUF6597 domain-containing transcriptional factor [Capillimicrobium sp.]|jgi:methylphosphotriester-DNA--protein-cysteine methyltransferase
MEHHYRELAPGPALHGVAASLWVQRVDGTAEPYAHRTVPHGGAEIACAVGAPARALGPLSRPRSDALAPGTTVVGVRVRPGAAPLVFDAPAHALLDGAVELRALWGADADALADAVAAAPDAAGAVAALERALARRLVARHGRAERDPLVAEAVRRLGPWPAARVQSLPAGLGISERQLRRRCHASVGVGPKALQRILRFQGFLALTHRGDWGADGLARAAADAGFADQAHLTRESLELSGATPAALLRDAREHCRGRHDHGATHRPLLIDRAQHLGLPR